MNMKQILLGLLAGLLTCMSVMAVPAKPVPFIHEQSDGTTVTLVMRGGEFNHSLMTLDGLTVARAINIHIIRL